MGNCQWYTHKQYIKKEQEAATVLQLGQQRMERNTASLKTAVIQLKAKEDDRIENRSNYTKSLITADEAIANDRRIISEINIHKGVLHRLNIRISNLVTAQAVLSETIENANDLAQSRSYVEGMKRLQLGTPSDMKMTESQWDTQQDTVRDMHEKNSSIAGIQKDNALELPAMEVGGDYDEDALIESTAFLQFGPNMVNVPLHAPQIRTELAKVIGSIPSMSSGQNHSFTKPNYTPLTLPVGVNRKADYNSVALASDLS